MRVSFLAALLVAISMPVPADVQGRVTVYTVNYPLQYFAQRIAGKHAEVIFPAPTDIDPSVNPI